MSEKQTFLSAPLIAFLGAMALIPMIWTQMLAALNTNHAWLLIVAERYLGGGRFGEDFFETNPPFSILIYVPQIWLHQYGGIPIEYTPYISTFLTIIIAAAILYSLLGRLFKDAPELKNLGLFSFVAAALFIPETLYFGDRDHIIFIALCPLLLGQYLITKDHHFRFTPTVVLYILGGLFLLIKPQYGLFPLAAFAHRLITKKSLKPIITAPDFCGLALSFVLYIGIITFAFPEYWSLVFSGLTELYIPIGYDRTLLSLAPYLALLIGLACAALLTKLTQEQKFTVLNLCALSAMGFVIYALQNKGFYYHLIPGYSFFFIGFFVFVWFLFEKEMPKNLGRKTLIQMAGILICCYYIHPPNTKFPTHKEYAALPLPGLLDNCENPCPHFIVSENMEVVFQSSLYSGAQNISRFPGLWWLQETIAREDEAHIQDLQARYIGYVKDDFTARPPKLMAIANNLKFRDNEQPFNLVQFLQEKDPEFFERFFAQYELSSELTDNRGSYFAGTALEYDFPIVYDIYTRKE